MHMKAEEFTNRYYTERWGTDCNKWDGLKSNFGHEDMLALWVADMDFKVPDEVTGALIKRVEHGVYGYTHASDAYYDSFLRWEKEKHGTYIDKEWIRFAPGVMAGIYWCIQALTEEKDGIIVNTPVYYPFQNAAKNLKRKLVCNELICNEGIYSIDYQRLEEQIVTEQVKLYILCSPHNPISRVWTEEELEKIFEICRKYQVIILADEIHQDFVFEGHRHCSSLTVGKGAYIDNIIMLNSASKTFNLAGMKNSFVTIPSRRLRSKFDEFMINIHIDTGNTLSYTAVTAAYNYGQKWLEGLLDTIYGNYQAILQIVAKELPEIRVTPLEGTYLLWVDLRPYVKASDVIEIVQERARVAVDFGEWFSPTCEGCIRMNLATSRDNVEKAVFAIINEIKKYKCSENSK